VATAIIIAELIADIATTQAVAVATAGQEAAIAGAIDISGRLELGNGAQALVLSSVSGACLGKTILLVGRVLARAQTASASGQPTSDRFAPKII
jgi:hypothetical protein